MAILLFFQGFSLPSKLLQTWQAALILKDLHVWMVLGDSQLEGGKDKIAKTLKEKKMNSSVRVSKR